MPPKIVDIRNFDNEVYIKKNIEKKIILIVPTFEFSQKDSHLWNLVVIEYSKISFITGDPV